MARVISCPYCWNRVAEKDLEYRCSTACSTDRGYFTVKAMGKGGLCPHGRRPVSGRFCPNCQQKRPLLREYIESDGHNIAVIGTAGSGKSTYVGVLLHELRGRVSTRFNGMAVDLLGDESRRSYEQRLAGPLFEQGIAVRKTARAQGDDQVEPIIFTLRIPGRSACPRQTSSASAATARSRTTRHSTTSSSPRPQRRATPTVTTAPRSRS